jgi:hypothetical protein
MLYLTAPSPVAMRYWKKVMAGPNGELWFAAHTRAAPDEMRSLAEALNSQINAAAKRAPALAELIAAHPAGGRRTNQMLGGEQQSGPRGFLLYGLGEVGVGPADEQVPHRERGSGTR